MKNTANKRAYAQYCPLARTLDRLGERWTLLIVRNLLLGPQRYKDLLEGLPGIGTNLLAARLRELAKAGVVQRRRLPPPAASDVYELTERGRALEPILLSLARWGMDSIGRRRPGEAVRPEWTPLGIKIFFSPEAAVGLHAIYEYRIEDQVFHLRIDDGRAEIVQGPADHADMVFTADSETALALGWGALRLSEALESGRLKLAGDPEAIARSARVFPTVR